VKRILDRIVAPKQVRRRRRKTGGPKLTPDFHCIRSFRTVRFAENQTSAFFSFFRNMKECSASTYGDVVYFPPLTSVRLVGHIWLRANIMNTFSYYLKSHTVYERIFIVL
jgi:hypothetical protein